MKPHILFIDGDQIEFNTFLEALKRVSTDDGFKCTYANTTSKALEMLRYLIPDFIFVDFNMINAKGFRFLSMVQNEDRFRNTKIYLYATTTSFVFYQREEIPGTFGYIERSNTVDNLTNILQNVLVSSSVVPTEI